MAHIFIHWAFAAHKKSLSQFYRVACIQNAFPSNLIWDWSICIIFPMNFRPSNKLNSENCLVMVATVTLCECECKSANKLKDKKIQWNIYGIIAHWYVMFGFLQCRLTSWTIPPAPIWLLRKAVMWHWGAQVKSFFSIFIASKINISELQLNLSSNFPTATGSPAPTITFRREDGEPIKLGGNEGESIAEKKISRVCNCMWNSP